MPRSAKEFYQVKLTDSERLNLIHQIDSKSRLVGDCKIFQGHQDKDSYGVMPIRFRDFARLNLRVHRLAFFVFQNIFLDSKIHVSHLCHNRLCCLPIHLSYEPQAINASRVGCNIRQRCSGDHSSYTDCLFEVGFGLVYICWRVDS